MISTIEKAWSELQAGLKMRRVWMALAAENIGDQHRRTSLGPLWLLINYLAYAGSIIVVFGRYDLGANYPAYVLLGLLVWLFMSDALTHGLTLFTREESFIKGTRLPLTVYVMRLTMELVTRAGYALAGCVIILLFIGVAVTASWIWSVLGALLILACTPAVITVMAFAGAYIPDLTFIVANVMRIGMFLTPVFWVHGGEGGLRGALYDYNPFTYFLEIVRTPIIDGRVPVAAFAICTVIVLAFWLAAILMLGKLRKQLVMVL